MIYKSILTIFFLVFSSVSYADSVNISNRLKASIDEDGQLTVKSNYMLHFLLKSADKNGKNIGIISPADGILKYDFNVLDLVYEKDSLFPKDFKFNPSLASTKYQPSKISLNEVLNNWRDIDYYFEGTDISRGLDGENITLFALDAFNVVNMAFSTISDMNKGASATKTFKVYKSVNKIAKKIANYKEFAQKASYYIGSIKLSLKYMEILMKYAEVGKNESDPLSVNWRLINSTTIKGIEILEKITKTTIKMKPEDKKKVMKNYKTLFNKRIKDKYTKKDISNKSIDETIKVLAKVYEKADVKKKEEIVNTMFLALSQEIIAFYQESLSDKIKENKKKIEDAKTSKKERKGLKEDNKNLKEKIFYTTMAKGFLTIVIYSKDFEYMFKLAKEKPDIVLDSILDVSSTVAAAYTIESADVAEAFFKKIAYKRFIKDSKNKLRKTVYKNGNAYMKAVAVGNTIANKLIPFVWDVFLAPDYLKFSMKDGKIQKFGLLKSKVLVKTDRNQSKVLSSYNNKSRELIISLEKGETIFVYADAFQSKLFDEAMSPWIINPSYVPSNLWGFLIQTPDSFSHNFTCVRKVFGDVEYSYHSENGSSYQYSPGQCGVGQGGVDLDWGSEWYKDSNTSKLYETTSEFPSKFKLSSFSSNMENDNLIAAEYRYNSDEIESITVTVFDMESKSTRYKIKLVPAIQNLEFSIDNAGITNDRLLVSFDNSSIKASTKDPIETQIWDWGDGSKTTLPAGTPLGSITHSYALQGAYTVKLLITTESGLISSVDKEVEVFSSSPLIISVDTSSDYDATVSWNKIYGATGYEICLSKTEIYNGVCPSQAVVETTTETNQLFHPLEGVTQYYVGVSYITASGQSEMSVKPFVTKGSEGDFNLVLDSATSTHLNISWEKPNGATSYKVCQSAGLYFHYTAATDCDSLIDSRFWTDITSENLSISTDPDNNPLQKDVTYYFRVVAFDGSDDVIGVSSSVSGKLTSNILPVARAGKDIVVSTAYNSIFLDGSKSTDDGSIDSYIWKEGDTLIGSGETISITSLPIGDHLITLIVTDNEGNTDTDKVLISVIDYVSGIHSVNYKYFSCLKQIISDNHLLYLLRDCSGSSPGTLTIVDANNPKELKTISNTSIPRRLDSAHKINNTIYLAYYEQGDTTFSRVDVSNPLTPILISEEHHKFKGNLLYLKKLFTYHGKLHIMQTSPFYQENKTEVLIPFDDISTLSTIEDYSFTISKDKTDSVIDSVIRDDTLIVLFARELEVGKLNYFLKAYDVSDISKPIYMSIYPLRVSDSDSVAIMAFKDNKLFLKGDYNRDGSILDVIDCSNLGHLNHMTSFLSQGVVSVDGSYVYSLSFNKHLHITDISNSINKVLKQQSFKLYPAGIGSHSGIERYENYSYFYSDNKVAFLDTSNNLSGLVIKDVFPSATRMKCSVSSKKLLCFSEKRLKIYDLDTDPNLGSIYPEIYRTYLNSFNFSLSNNRYLYILNSQDSLIEIIDIINGSTVTRALSSDANANLITDGNKLYIFNADFIDIYDISNSLSLLFIRKYESSVDLTNNRKTIRKGLLAIQSTTSGDMYLHDLEKGVEIGKVSLPFTTAYPIIDEDYLYIVSAGYNLPYTGIYKLSDLNEVGIIPVEISDMVIDDNIHIVTNGSYHILDKKNLISELLLEKSK